MSQQINLFNPRFEQKKQYLSSRTASQALGALIFGLLVWSVLGQRQVAGLERQEATAKAELAQVEARRDKVMQNYAPRSKDPALAQELAAVEAQRQLLRDASSVLARGELGNTQGYASYFRALAQARVEGVWLTGVSIAGNDIGLQGSALHAALLPAYIARLGQQDVLKGKTFSSLDIGPPGKEMPGDGKLPKQAYVAFSLQSPKVVAEAPVAQERGTR